MSDYQIFIARAVQKDLNALPTEVIKRIESTLEGLTNNSRPPGCRKLKGRKNNWRIRVGDYRIVYSIDEDSRTIDIVKIRHRIDVYE